MIDKDCPCTRDCPDRPNCKGCERFKVYKDKKFAEYKRKETERIYQQSQIDKWHKRAIANVKFKKGILK